MKKYSRQMYFNKIGMVTIESESDSQAEMIELCKKARIDRENSFPMYLEKTQYVTIFLLDKYNETFKYKAIYETGELFFKRVTYKNNKRHMLNHICIPVEIVAIEDFDEFKKAFNTLFSIEHNKQIDTRANNMKEKIEELKIAMKNCEHVLEELKTEKVEVL